MKPAPISNFSRPRTVAEASQRLIADAGAVVIAGGQSLIPMLALRVAPADELVQVTKIADLRLIRTVEGTLRVGAAVTHAEIEDGKVSGGAAPFLRNVAGGIAYRAVRNNGTIGGSLALADPAADWPAALLALDAKLSISGLSGVRTSSIDDFLQGAYTTSLQSGEVITEIAIAQPSAGTRFGYRKVSRKSGAFAMSIGAVVRVPGKAARVVVAGMQQRAWRLGETEKWAARDGAFDETAARTAIAADITRVEPDTDAYQLRLHTATILDAMREAW